MRNKKHFLRVSFPPFFRTFFACVVLVSCDAPPPASAPPPRITPPEELKGMHILRKMAAVKTEPYSKSNSETQGRFFIFAGFAGTSQSESGVKNIVHYCWQGTDSIYTFSSIELDAVRIKLIDTIQQPYVIFSTMVTYCGCDDCRQNGVDEVDRKKRTGSVNQKYATFVKEVTIVCKPEDWPSQVSLPMNEVKN